MPPSVISELTSNQNRITSLERVSRQKEIESNYPQKPVALTFLKYNRQHSTLLNPNFESEPEEILFYIQNDRIQSQWTSFPFPIVLTEVYISHKTEIDDIPSIQNFYECSIVTKGNDFQPDTVLTEFNISLNAYKSRRSTSNPNMWENSPLPNEDSSDMYFNYLKTLE